jgi:rhodanese-related sulfurtransferase
MINEITVQQLHAWLTEASANSDTQPPVLLDVREAFEFERANLRGAPMADAQLKEISMRQIPAAVSDLDPSAPTVVVCHHGGRSYQVAAFLQHQGFSNVINLAGGIDAWAKHIDPTVPVY